MNKKSSITLLYSGVAILCVLILGMSWFLANANSDDETALVNPSAPGRVLSTIKEGLPIETQSGTQRNLKDLEGKVWLFCQFFVDCPQCAQRNFTDLLAIANQYKDDPDFRIVCLSVNPEEDSVEQLAKYAESAKADEAFWWFARADKEKSYQWVRSQLFFHDIKERTDEAEIASKGRFAHDMAIAVIDKDGQMRGKFDLYSTKFQKPDLYETWKTEIARRIEVCLEEEVGKTRQ